jgi:tetratricopeptide (TPR) repeat protein
MQDAVSGSAIEAALYRAMQIPSATMLYPRPPKEAQGELGALISKSPDQAELYSLRAMEEERALDFRAAEADWKAYVARAKDAVGAKLEMADYYHRRLQASDEVRLLTEVGESSAAPREEYVAAADQRSWKAFERLLALASEQGLPEEVTEKAYAAWILRYPQQPSLYARELRWMLDESSDKQNLKKADALIEQYRKTFPHDPVFPLKAAALDAGFEPLWPADLVSSYYSLLGQTHQLRAFVSDARERLDKNPDDLNAMARLFYYAQQQGSLVQAQQVIDAYRLSKDARKAAWSAQELYTLATLTEQTHAYPEAARYDFALYNSKGSLSSGESPQATGLSGVIRILLTAPDQPVALGAGNLTMYRDLATVDQGPGYWNGVLSLWLNSSSPEQSYHEEEQRAQPYFHRAKAAELLAILDKNSPEATQRADLHKELIRVYADYGESALVVKAGDAFLGDFPSPANEGNRVAVAMYVADAYARQRDTKDEFALYDRLLTELGGMTAGMPLTAAKASSTAARKPAQTTDAQPDDSNATSSGKIEKSPAFEIDAGTAAGISVAGAQQYREVLERYLGRLTAAKQLPQALTVLRHELDRNPDDPLLYERLASFLEQNHLGAQQEEVYQQAIQKFQDTGWYDKLARLYLREKKREAFAALTKQVTDAFAGSDLEAYFRQVTHNDAQMYLELNLYAHQRFPHDEVFVRNLLNAYRSKGTYDDNAWVALLREHWSDAEDLRREFFDYLSTNGKLDAELAQLRALTPAESEQIANPAATRELAEAEMWRSHFEASAPLFNALAEAYPSDSEIGTEASSLDRSLAYYDASQTTKAAAIEKRLLAYDPANLDRLARIGDIYADSGADGARGHENLAAAAPYWRRMPAVHPGITDGYLQAATVFWDYFQFDDALADIRAARERFHRPALYGYEAGAIDEGKRDFEAAIHEYTGAALADSEGDAATRLLRLARRKATAKAVDDETAKALAMNSADPAALALRARVLEVEKRVAEIGPMLEAALTKTATLEEAQTIGSQAQSRSLPKVYEQALQKEIALARDPVEKLELSYDLMRSYEGRDDAEDAAHVVESVYRDNAKLLGVVRNTTDFYWRNKQPSKAIATLTVAASTASSAQPTLSRQFIVEAADKANQSGDYAQARALMAPLIDPAKYPEGAYNAQYMAVAADSYARSGDDAGLKKFYLDKLDALRGSAISVNERKEKTVLLRRGLIPALTRMKDYAGGVDQYIAILSAYAEDAGTAQEAALYALRYGRQRQLVDFAAQTVKASPRNSRFAILLAQINTTFEDYPAAVDAYAHAVTIRADRSDVFEAKATLEERLQRLDDACKDYERLYVLSYQDPQWMVKVAAVRARQGRKDDAVKALARAWIEGHPATAHEYFEVATQLESWQMLDDALRFAEEGRKAEGDALLAGAAPGEQSHDDPQGAVIYVRLMTRLRQQDKALSALDEALAAAAQSANAPGVILDQAQKQGIASVSNDEWRRHYVEERVNTANQRYRSAVVEMGKAAGTYFTPEEKQSFAQLIDGRFNQAQWQTGGDAKLRWIDVASAAGLAEEDAHLRKTVLLDATPSHAEAARAQFDSWARLERSRMNFVELAKTAEHYAKTLVADQQLPILNTAADAYRDAGDAAGELRTLESMSGDANVRERILALLLKQHPNDLATYGTDSQEDERAYAAANDAVSHADIKITRAALQAHDKNEVAPWQPAYSALAGLYFRDVSNETATAFRTTVADDRTVGQRLTERKNEGASALSGNVWFYYGMRDGVFRTLAPKAQWAQNDPEDLLPAELERSASAANYAELARSYAEAGETESALREYNHALELAPDSATVYDAMASLLWDVQRKDEAIQQWRDAFSALNRVQNKGAAPESFWSDFSLIAKHIGRRKLFADVRPDMEAVLRNYIGRNGEYRSNELLQAAFAASGGGVGGATWLISLSSAGQDAASVLADIDNAPWLTPEARELILLRELKLIRAQPLPSGAQESSADWRLNNVQGALLALYLVQKQDSKAEVILSSMTRQRRDEADAFTAEVELAAHGHRLTPFLANLGNDANAQSAAASGAVSVSLESRFQTLRGTAASLEHEGDKADALVIWEYVFAQLELNHNLAASDYAGLARTRLINNDAAGAVAVLRRMTLNGSGDDAQGTATAYDSAARLLELNNHEAEAIEFLTALVKEQPWNADYSIRLARAQLHASRDSSSAAAALKTIASNRVNGYEQRVQAVLLLRDGNHQPVDFGSKGLALLAAGKITPQEARQPYFAAARIAAADDAGSSAERERLLREAIAIAPQGLDGQVGFTGSDVRLKIFRAEAAQDNNATALAVLQTLMQPGTANAEADTSNEPGVGSDAGVDTDTASGAGSDTAASGADSATYEDLREGIALKTESLDVLERRVSLPGSDLRTNADRLALSVAIAQVYQQTGNDASALPYLKLAAALETDKARATDLNNRWRSLEIDLALEAENSGRRPTIRKALDQSGEVRPRITKAEIGAAMTQGEAK